MQQEVFSTEGLAGAAMQINKTGRAPVLLICEHASNHMPAKYNNLGLGPEALASHIAWDPGAFDVAKNLAKTLDAPLVAGTVSRLIFDCNRPPDALDAMPAQSEIFTIPGNQALSPSERAERVSSVYTPFHNTISKRLAATPAPAALVTIHSFTPIYNGQARDVEIGVLHDKDTRLADVLLAHAPRLNVTRNEPYGPTQGVTYTLKEHGIANGLLNVMLEIRNDLLRTPAESKQMAHMLSDWLGAAFSELGIAMDETGAKCQS